MERLTRIEEDCHLKMA